MDQFPDKVGRNRAGDVCVRFNGELQRPHFSNTGAAEVFLSALQAGTRQPEPEEPPCIRCGAVDGHKRGCGETLDKEGE